MRTTLTLDDDIAAKLSDLAHNLRKPFKEIVNDTLRRGLGGGEASESKPFTVRPFATELRPGFDPRGFNKLYDEMETDEFLKKRSKKR